MGMADIISNVKFVTCKVIYEIAHFDFIEKHWLLNNFGKELHELIDDQDEDVR